MKWPVLLMVGVILSLAPSAAMAQSGAGRGGRGAGGSVGAGRANVPSNDPTIDSISRAIAAEATAEQQQQFQSAARNADAARKMAADWKTSLAGASEPSNYAGELASLQAALDKAKQANNDFLQSFSKTQTEELKEQVKKVNKAAHEVDAKWKPVAQESQRLGTDRQKLSGRVVQLMEALTNFRREQQTLGNKMGIRTPEE